jgi:uncharacterized protein YeaO (DUF488 family)
MITLKRAYDSVSATDGTRYLVERLWPRGVQKAKLRVHGWLKDVAPSTELRKWFNHDPGKWGEFRRRYFRELDSEPEAWRPIVSAARRGRVTLVYSSHDTDHNNAVALQEYLQRKVRRSAIPRKERHRRSLVLSLALTLLLAGAASLHAQAPFASAAAVRDLVHVMDQYRLDAIAAADPADPGTFVAALYIPGSQLLVLSARHPSAEAVADRIAMRRFREVYLDLQGTPTPRDKFFVQDSRADGILSAFPGSGDVDVLYEDGVRRTLFNGDIDAQHLTSAEYDARLAAADARYARLLILLASAARRLHQ